ncbi:DUF2897 family protein [Aliiglaciecola lipolytica]|uniref:DUF2897 domain-containing protein n=1 Tax=Aliiglaciecola lipolytica E3 TaxID=1127673 RepID=K6YBU8_9ALTE|nr:DUF2897 family protein [Aliiglaciecola lipolytica]GAC14123.1 hypothetical protein GLIP_1488 [Aliiglaciecola lipolytica E3]
MNIWLIVSLLIAIGLVVGNILLLKMSAKMKFEKTESKPGDKIIASDSTDDQSDNEQRQDANKP